MTATGAIKSPLLLARGKTIALDSLSTLTRRQRDRKVKSGDTDAKKKNEWQYKKNNRRRFYPSLHSPHFQSEGERKATAR